MCELSPSASAFVFFTQTKGLTGFAVCSLEFLNWVLWHTDAGRAAAVYM